MVDSKMKIGKLIELLKELNLEKEIVWGYPFKKNPLSSTTKTIDYQFILNELCIINMEELKLNGTNVNIKDKSFLPFIITSEKAIKNQSNDIEIVKLLKQSENE